VGFSCELNDSPAGGICCPQFEVLYELYGEDQEKPTKDDGFDLPRVPNVPVVIVDDKEVRWF
jgi:hypothetical protein